MQGMWIPAFLMIVGTSCHDILVSLPSMISARGGVSLPTPASRAVATEPKEEVCISRSLAALANPAVTSGRVDTKNKDTSRLGTDPASSYASAGCRDSGTVNQ